MGQCGNSCRLGDVMGKTLRWRYTVPGNKKNKILVLTAVQAIYGASGVLYALLLHNIVDAAVYHDRSSFWYGVICIAALVAALIMIIVRKAGPPGRAHAQDPLLLRITLPATAWPNSAKPAWNLPSTTSPFQSAKANLSHCPEKAAAERPPHSRSSWEPSHRTDAAPI